MPCVHLCFSVSRPSEPFLGQVCSLPHSSLSFCMETFILASHAPQHGHESNSYVEYGRSWVT
ncbi:hypothetical protein AAZX31_18G160200 [Glycine max]